MQCCLADVRVIVFTGCSEALPAARLAELGVGEVFLKASTDFQRLLRVLS